jgi:hypothetical protein
MPAADVPMVIDQGEDWTTDVVWTDSFDDPVEVVHPCKLAIRDKAGQTLLELETNPDIPEGEIPGINTSSEIGLLQLHIDKAVTASLLPGYYLYDLFVTMDDGNMLTGPQTTRLLFGTVIVNKRITVM